MVLNMIPKEEKVIITYISGNDILEVDGILKATGSYHLGSGYIEFVHNNHLIAIPAEKIIQIYFVDEYEKRK